MHIVMQLRHRRQILVQDTPPLDVGVDAMDFCRCGEDLGVSRPGDAVVPAQTIEAVGAVDEPAAEVSVDGFL